jgi:hypothetical protein
MTKQQIINHLNLCNLLLNNKQFIRHSNLGTFNDWRIEKVYFFLVFIIHMCTRNLADGSLVADVWEKKNELVSVNAHHTGTSPILKKRGEKKTQNGEEQRNKKRE